MSRTQSPLRAEGQSRRFDPLPVTSGLPRTTDINRPAPLFRFVPSTEVHATTDNPLTLPARAGLLFAVGLLQASIASS